MACLVLRWGNPSEGKNTPASVPSSNLGFAAVEGGQGPGQGVGSQGWPLLPIWVSRPFWAGWALHHTPPESDATRLSASR
jgi:hypothetical protein